MALDKIVVRLNEETKKKFKSECVLRGVTMENQVERLIEDYLKSLESKGQRTPYSGIKK